MFFAFSQKQNLAVAICCCTFSLPPPHCKPRGSEAGSQSEEEEEVVEEEGECRAVAKFQLTQNLLPGKHKESFSRRKRQKKKKRSEILVSAGAPGHFPKMPDAELFAAV